MCARLFWPYLTLGVTALRRNAPLQPPEWEAIYTLDLRNLRHIKLRKGLTKCRDRRGQARPIICVLFWAITGSLCLPLSLFVSHSLFFLYRHQLWPVHKRGDQVQGAHFGCPKRGSKMAQAYFFSFFGMYFVLFTYYFMGRRSIAKNMGAILQPLSAQILLDISVCKQLHSKLFPQVTPDGGGVSKEDDRRNAQAMQRRSSERETEERQQQQQQQSV